MQTNEALRINAYALGFAYRLGQLYAAGKFKLANDDDFKESDHPRDENGRFKSGAAAFAKTSKQRAAQKRYHAVLLDKVKEQSPQVQKIISSIQLFRSKDSILPPMPQSVLKRVDLSEGKPVVLATHSFMRNIKAHREINVASYKYILGLVLYGTGQRLLPSKREHYTRIAVALNDKQHNEVILDIRNEQDQYRIVHMEKQKNKKGEW